MSRPEDDFATTIGELNIPAPAGTFIPSLLEKKGLSSRDTTTVDGALIAWSIIVTSDK
jgi:hypothetical protein